MLVDDSSIDLILKYSIKDTSFWLGLTFTTSLWLKRQSAICCAELTGATGETVPGAGGDF